MATTEIRGEQVLDGTLTNSDISNSASIAGTKINPSFGSQNVSTTGNLSGAQLSLTLDAILKNGKKLQLRNFGDSGVAAQLFTDPNDDAVLQVFGDKLFEILDHAGVQMLKLDTGTATLAVSGTASPTLIVDGTASANIELKEGGVHFGGMYTGNDDITILSTAGHDIRFDAGGSTKAILLEGGNLNIGYTGVNSTNRLWVEHGSASAAINTAPIVRIKNSAGSGNYATLHFGGTVSDGFIGFLDHSTAASRKIDFAPDGSTVRMSLKSGGLLGVGIDPATTIHADSSTGGIIRASRTGAGAGVIQMEADGTDGTLTATNKLLFSAGGSVRARIHAGGNFSIGSVADVAKLFVDGTLRVDTGLATFNAGIHTSAFRLGTTTTAGWVLTADASGNGTWQESTGGGGTPSAVEPPAVSSSTSGAVGVSEDYARGDHSHDLGTHAHTGATDGGQIAASSLSGTNTAFNKSFGSSAGTVCEGNDGRLSDSRTCNNSFDNITTARTNLDVYSKSEGDSRYAQTASSETISGTWNFTSDIGFNEASPGARIHVSGVGMNDATSGLRLDGAYPWIYYYDTELNQASWVSWIDGNNYYLKTIPYADRNAADLTAVGTTVVSVTPAGTLSATTFSGGNVTSGADPGHTHSGSSLSNILESSITDGSILARVASTETISGSWTFTQSPRWNDSVQVQLGTDNDAQIYHDGSSAYWNVQGAGNLYLRLNGTENAVRCLANAGVALYYDSLGKLETTATGVSVTGTMAATTVTGANVTSGADPGHTHTGGSISGLTTADFTSTNISQWTNDSGYITGNQTITLSGDATGSGTTAITVAVVDDSHSHTTATISGLDASNDFTTGTLPIARGGTGGKYLGNLGADPGSPSAGDFWFNTVDSQFKGYNGTQVVVMG